MTSSQILECGELAALLDSIDAGLARVSTLKRSQLISLCSSMSEAISHFRSAQISQQFMTADPPIVLRIVVAGDTTVGVAMAADATTNVCAEPVPSFDKGVGDGPAILHAKSVSTQDEFDVGAVSFIDEPAVDDENDYTAEE
ncbi:hypothetical protein CYMTET_8160 [Cymbomonas tetramitiformis]|uniref:Uncharacterized protein n=1 Tax=Cymbomonas tetramitiformis TaxID=36881 RepID=A0AAE0GU01_9CHLO|nr:hypothetical protein CYMTET_8160 [Cymbomonas tetramitiformis]